MSFGKSIFGRLSTTAAVKAIIDKRVFPQFDKKGKRPSVVYEQTEFEADRVYSGASGLRRYAGRVHSIADSKEAAETLGQAVFTALDDESGTWGGITVTGCFATGEDEDVTTIDNGTDKPVYAKSLDVLIWANV